MIQQGLVPGDHTIQRSHQWSWNRDKQYSSKMSQGCIRMWGLIRVLGLLKPAPPAAGQNSGLQTLLKAVFAYTAFTSLNVSCCIFPTLIWSTPGLPTNAPLKISAITYDIQPSLLGICQAQPMLHWFWITRISTCISRSLFLETFASNSVKFPPHV